MPDDPYIWHVTLTTGHGRRSPRSEVADVAIAAVQDALGAAVAGGRPAVPGMAGCTLSAAAAGPCLIATIWSGAAPVVTLGVAGRSRCGPRLWRLLHDQPTGLPPLATDPAAPPGAPWCGVRLDPGAMLIGRDALLAIADLERVLAWAWLSRLDGAG